MNEVQDIMMETILSTLSEKIAPDVLKKANTRAIRKKLLRNLTNELFYKLMKEGKLSLCPGFGSVILKEIKEKDKKIFNRRTGEMQTHHVRGKKVVYKPGDNVRELL